MWFLPRPKQALHFYARQAGGDQRMGKRGSLDEAVSEGHKDDLSSYAYRNTEHPMQAIPPTPLDFNVELLNVLFP